MPDISEQEVWLRAYCSALAGYLSRNLGGWSDATAFAKQISNQAVKDFAERFPPFQFASNESKIITAPTDPIDRGRGTTTGFVV